MNHVSTSHSELNFQEWQRVRQITIARLRRFNTLWLVPFTKKSGASPTLNPLLPTLSPLVIEEKGSLWPYMLALRIELRKLWGLIFKSYFFPLKKISSMDLPPLFAFCRT